MSSIVTFNIQYDPAVIYEGDFDVHNTLVITALTDNCNIYLKRNNTPSTSSFEDTPINIFYSLDGGISWLELNLESQSSSYIVNLGTLNASQTIMIRGNNIERSTLYGLNICTDKSASVSGNIMSLLYKKTPSTTLPQYNTYGVFQGIFSGSKITDASQLPLPVILRDYCYAYMFENCTALTSVPALSATTLEEYCYQGMFKGCTALVNAPELASTSLAEGCYKEMLKGCSSITTAPTLPATTLITGCYANMFENCTSLNYIHIYSEMQIGIPYTTDWVKNVAQRGTFVGSDNIEYTEIGVNGIPTTWVYQIDYEKKYFTIESLANNNELRIEYMKRINSQDYNDSHPFFDLQLYYSLDNGTTWNIINKYKPDSFVTLNTGDTVIIKGNNNSLYKEYTDPDTGDELLQSTIFDSSSMYKVYGNVMSLLNGDNFRTNSEFASGSSYNFRELFILNDVVDASNLILPATTLTEGCYRDMFRACNSLITAPSVLPATTLAYECYYWMFARCPSLTSAPELPTTTLAERCYAYMFYECTGLTTAPELPATTLANGCYYNMFSGCTSLTAAPELPVTTLADSCYACMFEGCTSITTAPELPATTLTNSCYVNMFCGCTSLDAAPVLPATTLTSNCYAGMFEGCTSITTAPELPATTLIFGCYQYMFKDCTSLTTAPELPAITLANYCYDSMFEGCSSLNYIKAMFTTTPSASYTYNWVNGVASSGTFVRNDEATWNVIGNNGIPTGWVIYPIVYSQEYLTIESLSDNNTIRFNNIESAEAKTIYWSSDKTTWNSVSSTSSGTTIKTLSNNEKIYIKGSNNNYASSTSLYNYFNSDAEFNISGNIMSLIYGDNFIGQTTLPSPNYIFCSIFRSSKVVDASNLILPATTLADYCYQNMFRDCTSLISAPELPATTLANYCYQGMFYGCTSLTTASELPATTLANYCYQNMFYGCTSLTTTPALQATTLTNYCYQMMFRGCTSLTSAPELPATTLTISCYSNMFYGCTSLTSAPELPATTLASSCYSTMFRGCTSLTSAPELPATTLAGSCYSQMFYGCTSLISAPELPATTLTNNCYSNMFNGCRSLSYIKCLATNISATGSHGSWVSNVAATGTFVKPSSMTSWTTGVGGIPSGWTVQNI